MDLKRKVIIGISIILLIVALYFIISDSCKKSPVNESIPCCEQNKSGYNIRILSVTYGNKQNLTMTRLIFTGGFLGAGKTTLVMNYGPDAERTGKKGRRIEQTTRLLISSTQNCSGRGT